MIRACLAAALCVVLPLNAAAGTPRMDLAVDAQVSGLVSVLPTVGGIIGVAHNGALIYTKPFGSRELKTRAPIDAQTRFEIGSVSKQFTAAAVLQLSEHRKLALDDRLSAYLPAFPHAKELTLRQLLYQVSGLPDYADMPAASEFMSHADGSADRVAAEIKGPLDFKPGSKWEYSSTNYYVLGRVIEIVSHLTYEMYVRSHLFLPARMTHSGFIDDEARMSDFAKPYHEGRPAPPTFESWAGGAGAIVSTVGDLVAWNAALRAGKIVSRSDYTLMTSPGRLLNGARTDYGMGISIDTRDGHPRLWHNGATNGSVAIDSMFPRDHLDIIVLENSTGGNDPGVVERAVLDAIFPDALAIAREPVKGETPLIRNRIVGVITHVLAGTLPRNDTTPAFWKFWNARRANFAAYFKPFGAPQREIFKGSFDEGKTTTYVYRVEFAHTTRNCSIEIDKATNLVSSVGIAPPG